jgi:DNA-binding MarR family transcriptional regulator
MSFTTQARWESPGDPEVESELARVAAFRTELRRFLRRTDVVTSRAGLTPQRYDLLLMIRSATAADGGEAGGVRVTELCELLQLQQTAVTELVKRAEEAGLVDRRPSREDRRVSLLRLTAEGERRLLDVFQALRADRRALGASFAELDLRFRATTE